MYSSIYTVLVTHPVILCVASKSISHRVNKTVVIYIHTLIHIHLCIDIVTYINPTMCC